MLLLSSVFCFAIAISPEGNSNHKLSRIIQSGMLSTNEPIYFVVGGHPEVKARFQFSFKYRVLDAENIVVSTLPLLKNLFIGYTQASLWELDADSYPFEDTSFRPSLFIDHYLNYESSFLPSFVRTGFEHESNGRDGDDSRTRATFFVWPFWSRNIAGLPFIFAPKIFGYTSKDDENPDIADYRSYVDLLLRYGGEQDWSASMNYRYSKESDSGAFVEFSQPVRKSKDGHTGGYIYIQLFRGYGESLLAYNEYRDTQFRLGFGFVR